MGYNATPITNQSVRALQDYSSQRNLPWDIDNPTRNNTRAAARAAYYVAQYAAEAGGDVPEAVQDFLNDLRHLADALDVDIDEVWVTAGSRYDEEIAGAY